MNIYNRINNIITELANAKSGVTAEAVSQKYDIPIQQLHRDLCFMQNHKLFNSILSSYDIEGVTYYMLDSTAFKQCPKLCHEFYERFNSAEVKLLSVSSLELLFVMATDPLTNSNNIYYYFSDELLPKIDTILSLQTNLPDAYENPIVIPYIEKAIQNNETLRIGNILITPHFIKRDMNTGNLYIVEASTEEGDNYISAMEITLWCDNVEDTYYNDVKTESVSDENILRIHSLWCYDEKSLDEALDEEPTHVKVKFYDDNDFVTAKFKRDIQYRPLGKITGPFFDSSSFYYYEDTVLGLNKFKIWLESLGDCAVLLEPKELAYEIYRGLA